MAVKEREELHQLINELPDTELEIARDLLEALRKHVRHNLRELLETASLDDEPLTEEERIALEEGREAMRRGEVVSWEEISREVDL